MRSLLLLHGPNLNKLGMRNPAIYGKLTLKNIEENARSVAFQHGYHLFTYQSNHEGVLIDLLQTEGDKSAGIIINAGAFTHYSYAIHDAILDCEKPTVEVHLSDLSIREAWRQHSVIAPVCITTIMGKKEQGYLEAIEFMVRYLDHAAT